MTEGSKFPVAEAEYASFDGATRARVRCVRPDRASFWDRVPPDTYLIPRGAGLSYAAASFSPDAVTTEHGNFNRILSYDEREHLIEVEAGITLGAIFDFLTPRGRFLAVQPGHPRITVGGCAAADVHGKNQFRDGTFLSLVKAARLFHPSHGVTEISETSNRDLFRLTCGGYGLTGNILSLTLRTKAIQSPFIRMRTTYLPNARALPEQLKIASERADLAFTWHDFTARGESFGRGFIREGNFEGPDAGHFPPTARGVPHPSLSGEDRGSLRLRFFNRASTRPFNWLYFRGTRIGKRESRIGLYDFMFPVHDKQIYFKLFGRQGFHEYQAVIPYEKYGHYIDAVKARLQGSPLPITLASAKIFKGESELLRFTGTGICFALDFPRTAGGEEFARFLDGLMVEVGGIPNVIKDSRLTAAVVEKTYGDGYGEFRRRLRELDPKRIYRSHLSTRLGL